MKLLKTKVTMSYDDFTASTQPLSTQLLLAPPDVPAVHGSELSARLNGAVWD